MDQFPRRTPKDARAHIKKTVGDFRDLIRRRIVELKLSSSDKAKFLALLGETKLAGELRHSNLRAWEQFAKLVINEVRDLERSNDLDFFHVTLLADEGIRSDRRPYIPLDPLKRKIDKSLRKAGVDGIYRMEVSPLMNWPQKGKGRTLLCHGHALIWVEKGIFDNFIYPIKLSADSKIDFGLFCINWYRINCQSKGTFVISGNERPNKFRFLYNII